jgi:hypothetical protein
MMKDRMTSKFGERLFVDKLPAWTNVIVSSPIFRHSVIPSFALTKLRRPLILVIVPLVKYRLRSKLRAMEFVQVRTRMGAPTIWRELSSTCVSLKEDATMREMSLMTGLMMSTSKWNPHICFRPVG